MTSNYPLTTTVAGEQFISPTAGTSEVLYLGDGDKVNKQATIPTPRKVISMIHKMHTLNNMALLLDTTLFQDHQSRSYRRTQGPLRSTRTRQVPKLLTLLLPLCIAGPSSTLAISANNCSMAQVRHSQRDHGNPVGVIPAQPTSANNVGSVDDPKVPTTLSPFLVPSSALAIHSTITSTFTIPEPPIRLSTTATSIHVAISFSTMTIRPMTMGSLTPTSSLHPVSAPPGTIISMPPIFTPPDPTVTIPSTTSGSLEQSTSSSAPNTPPTSSPSSTPPASPNPTPLIAAEAIFIALGGIALIVVTFLVFRRSARRARARAPRREVELVEIQTSRRAEAVRDGILNRGVPAPRNSLEEILAAAAAARNRKPAARPGPGPALERYSALDVMDGVLGRAGPARQDAGRSASKGGDGEWETLPPYAK